MDRFQSIKVGDEAQITHTITQRDVETFAGLTGDDNRLHLDKEFASKTAFKKPVAHGMLGASFISTVIGTRLPGDGALWFAQSLEFLRPVRVGDKIRVKAKVIKKVERLRTLEIQTDIFNQDKQLVTTGVAKVKVVPQKVPAKQRKFDSRRQVALVLGGTGGIGRAVCLRLARDGFDVAVHYHRNKVLAAKIKKQVETCGRRAMVLSGDITDEIQAKDMISQAAARLGGITALVNCVTATTPNVRFDNLAWEDIQKHLDLQIKGSFMLIKHVVPVMEKQSYGKIVHITTQYTEAPVPELAHYITAKSALAGFSRALAVELAAKGICLNLVSPGMTDTDLIIDVPEKVKLLTEARTPLKRLAQPEDVAAAVGYLCSAGSDFMTGETLRVNGGQVMR